MTTLTGITTLMPSTTISFHSVPIDLAIAPCSPGRPSRGESGLETSAGEHDHAESATDGRRIRRVRNRDRVVDEFIGFARSTGEAPDTDQLAEASKLSVRSIYRYFTSHEELLASVAERLAEHAAAEFDPGDPIDDDLCSRISRLVDTTLRFHHRYGPAIRLVSTQQRRGDAIDVALHRIDESRRNQIEILLDRELGHDEHRADTIAVIGVGLAVAGLTFLTDTFPGQTTRIRALLQRHVAAQLGLSDGHSSIGNLDRVSA